MNLYPAMTALQMQKLAMKHWEEWRPKATAQMKRANTFRTRARKAAEKAKKEMREMIQSGQPAHEAEEIVLKRYILLKPEKEVIEAMENDD
ncbi:MAG: hypothetical protein SCH72_12450 [Desulfuromonadales bacterium]|nr:hypothetical protein [Desulfuromonadales bacterium]